MTQTAGTLELLDAIDNPVSSKNGKMIPFLVVKKDRPKNMVEKWQFEDGNYRQQFCVHVSSKTWTRQDTANALCAEICKDKKLAEQHVQRHLRFVCERIDGVDISGVCRRHF